MLVTTPQLNAGEHMRHLVMCELRLPDPSEEADAYFRNGSPIRCSPVHAEIEVAGDGQVRLRLSRYWLGPLPLVGGWAELATRQERALLAVGTVPRPRWLDIDTYLDRQTDHIALCFVTVTRTLVGVS